MLAQQRILQSLISRLAEADPEVLSRLKLDFGKGHNLGEYEQDHASTGHYADDFIREIEALIGCERRSDTSSRAAGMSTKSASLARKRSQATSEGRKVLALEMIADQLRVIAEYLVGYDGPEWNIALEEAEAAAGDRRAGDRWENEGGPVEAV